MIPALLDKVSTVLLIGAHADDIEIGCGGTVLKLAQERPDVEVHWVIFSGNEERADEAAESAAAFMQGFSRQNIRQLTFTDGFFPAEWKAIKSEFEAVKQVVDPDVIFTHYGRDAHQDHRVVSELTWNTFRNHLILEYEIPKYDGDLGAPGVFIPLSAEIACRKTRLILENFPSQKAKSWFDPELFSALMRLRGMECAAAENMAEAFYCRKLCLG